MPTRAEQRSTVSCAVEIAPKYESRSDARSPLLMMRSIRSGQLTTEAGTSVLTCGVLIEIHLCFRQIDHDSRIQLDQSSLELVGCRGSGPEVELLGYSIATDDSCY